MEPKLEISEFAQGQYVGPLLFLEWKAVTGELQQVFLSDSAQLQLLKALLAVPPAANTKPHRSLSPISTEVKQTSEDRLGLVLGLPGGLALHVVLSRAMAEQLRQQLQAEANQ